MQSRFPPPPSAPSRSRPGPTSVLPPPLYEGGARLLDWKHTARGGMSVDLGVRDGSPTETHPFKGLSCGKEHGQRLRLWIGPYREAADESPRDSDAPYYKGEGILMRWSDDSVMGMMIRTLIDAGPDGTDGKHPFEGFSTGKKEGDLLHFAAWAVADDETLQHPLRTRRRTPFHELSDTAQTQILCRDARFVSFLARIEGEAASGVSPVRPESDPLAFASWTLKALLGVESRAVLGEETMEGARARRKWADLSRRYFESAEWRAPRG